MLDKAADTSNGFDANTGYDYIQLISKFAMGAVFYNQAVDNYLDEKMAKRLAEYKVSRVSVSIDSMDEKIHDEIRGRKDSWRS